MTLERIGNYAKKEFHKKKLGKKETSEKRNQKKGTFQ